MRDLKLTSINETTKCLDMKRLWLTVMFCCATLSLTLAQERTLSGTVLDAADGCPLIAATVSLKGSPLSVRTDKNGCFTLKADGEAWLIVRYNGYKTVEVPVRQRALIDIVLQKEQQVEEQALLFNEEQP